MKKYKPGQVSAVLFAKKNEAAQSESSPLARLFSTPAAVTLSAMKSPQSVDSTSNEKRKKLPGLSIKENDPPPIVPTQTIRKKKLKANKLDMSPHRKGKKRQLPKELSDQEETTVSPKKQKHRKLHNEDPDIGSATTEKLLDEISHAETSLPGKKTKLSQIEKEGKVSRPRRDRQRDKTADKRTIFVGNCPLSADKKKLTKLFQSYGKIESVRLRCAPPGDPSLPRRAIVITKNFHEQCSSYVAYIVFNEEEAAEKALEKNGYLLDSLHLRVDIAGSAKKHDKKRSVFVGNLPFTVSEEDIRSHFEDCGSISNIRIVRDRQTSLGKGFCYVQFESKDSVSLALKLNGSELEGRSLRVMVCVNKPKVKDKDEKGGKNKKIKEKPKVKKPSFAPSNASGTSFKNLLKTKKDKRLRKLKKKKEGAKKIDGLSSIFGDTPASGKISKKKNVKVGRKENKKKAFGPKRKSGQRGAAFAGKKGKKQKN